MSSLAERYLAKVDQRGENECWPWIASIDTHGYGNFNVGGYCEKAHRVGWFVWFGEWPGEFFVLHSCDNPPCQNPKHWRLGTHTENMHDKVTRSRQHRMPGESNPNAKVSLEIALQIKSEYVYRKNGGVIALAKKYGISKSQVHNIVTGESWKDAALSAEEDDE